MPLHGYFKKFQWEIQGSFKCVSRVFQERIKGDSRGIEGNCNGVFKLVSRKLRVFHGKLRGVPRDLGI